MSIGGKMIGTISILQMTNNKISAEWRVAEYDIINNANSVTSPTFSLLTDGHLLTFSLKIDTCNRYKLILASNPTNVGSCILTLSLRRPAVPDVWRTQLLEYWSGNYTFNCLGYLPQQLEKLANGSSRYPESNSSLIKCDITWLGFHDNKTPRTTHHPSELCIPTVPYQKELMPDVKLIVEDKELTAHKSILTLHSPVFLSMFQAPMKEAKESRVVIEDIDFSTMEALIGILYSGKTEELSDVEKALKMMAAAEKYQMLKIKTACEYKLQLQIKTDNVSKLLDEADKYNAEQLCQTCIEFIIAERKIIPFETLKEMCLKSPNLSSALINTQLQKMYSYPSNISTHPTQKYIG